MIRADSSQLLPSQGDGWGLGREGPFSQAVLNSVSISGDLHWIWGSGSGEESVDVFRGDEGTSLPMSPRAPDSIWVGAKLQN